MSHCNHCLAARHLDKNAADGVIPTDAQAVVLLKAQKEHFAGIASLYSRGGGVWDNPSAVDMACENIKALNVAIAAIQRLRRVVKAIDDL